MFVRRTVVMPHGLTVDRPPQRGEGERVAGQNRLVAEGFDIEGLLARGKQLSDNRLQLTNEIRAKHGQLRREHGEHERRAREAADRQQQWVMMRELVRGVQGAEAEAEEIGRIIDTTMQREDSQSRRFKAAADEKAAELAVITDMVRALLPEPAPPTCSICYDAPVREAAACGHNFCSGCILGMTRCHICQRPCSARDFRTLFFA